MTVATACSTATVLNAAHPRTAPTASETILLVDDDENVRYVAAATLRRRGYRVIESATPGEALRIAGDRNTAIHLVLSDVMLPEMDGRRLTDALRQARPGIKVLLMTGSPDEALRPLGIVCEEILSKPFTPWALANRVWCTLHEAGVLAAAPRGDVRECPAQFVTPY